jgi:hypothetical protein
MSFIADDIEDKCRRIARKVAKDASEATPNTFIGREMALLLDHMDTIRKRHKNQRAQLLEKELDIGTQILNTEERIDLIPNRMERMRLVRELKQMLDRITLASQHLATETESALQHLQERLLKLWNMHDQLSNDHGDTETTA